jgi:hypothetical protein
VEAVIPHHILENEGGEKMENGMCLQIFRNHSMALIRHDDGFAVAELLEDEIVKGDELRGDWEELGSTRIFNTTQNCYQEVYLQGSWATAVSALKTNGG